MTYVEKYVINVTVGNVQKMKCELKGLVNMNMQVRETVKLYQNPACKSIYQEPFEHIKARIKGRHNGGYSRKNDHQEKWL